MAEFGNKVTVLTSKGSLDNLDKVAIGTAQIDFTKDDAQSMEAKAKILRENPGLVEYQKVVQWNGILPTTMVPGSSVPFVNIK